MKRHFCRTVKWIGVRLQASLVRMLSYGTIAALALMLSHGTAAARPGEAAPGPLVLLGSDKATYGLNELMTITFAADADGYVALYAVNPRGVVAPLKEERVEKGRFYHLSATTDRPKGRHFLVAVFSGDRQTDAEGGKAFAKGLTEETMAPGSSKDIRPVESPRTFAVYPLVIQEFRDNGGKER